METKIIPNLLKNMALRRGFEPLTCPLGGGRAIHLCHRSVAKNPGHSSTGCSLAGSSMPISRGSNSQVMQ